MYTKRRWFMSKLGCFDMVLDFYRPQSRIMMRKLATHPVVVRHFLVGTACQARGQLQDLDRCKWDVCVVGAVSPRRKRLYARLRDSGCTLSPLETDDFKSVIVQSRIVLNVHYAWCDTFEVPRIIEAFANGTCVVTEPCYAMSELVPSNCYVCATYGEIVEQVRSLLNHPDQISRVGSAAARYYREEYDVNSRQGYRDILEAIPK